MGQSVPRPHRRSRYPSVFSSTFIFPLVHSESFGCGLLPRVGHDLGSISRWYDSAVMGFDHARSTAAVRKRWALHVSKPKTHRTAIVPARTPILAANHCQGDRSCPFPPIVQGRCRQHARDAIAEGSTVGRLTDCCASAAWGTILTQIKRGRNQRTSDASGEINGSTYPVRTKHSGLLTLLWAQ